MVHGTVVADMGHGVWKVAYDGDPEPSESGVAALFASDEPLPDSGSDPVTPSDTVEVPAIDDAAAGL